MMRNKRTALSETAVSTKDAKRHTGYWFAAVLVFFCFLIPAQVAAEDAPGAGCSPEGDFEFNLSSGYRLGGLHWNIAGDLSGENPNILSELTWSKLQILQIEATGTLNIERLTVRADVGYGYVLAGDAQDSDYDSDDRNDEFSRSYSNAGGGYLLNALTGLGYRYEFRTAPVALLPMIGIAFHRQAMKMTDGVLVISVPPSSTLPLGPIDGLDSSYTANWLDLWIGLDVEYQIARRVSAAAAVSVHPSLYYAEADWNLRSDFMHPVSFIHRTSGLGFCGELSAGIELSRCFLLEGRFTAEYWFGGAGVDETYRAVGGSVETRLNEVIWSSVQFSVGTVLRL
jgi:hypothetical protein